MIKMRTGFHEGELAVQRRAGVEGQAARLAPMADRSELGAGAAMFVGSATFAALTARDRTGRLWTSPLVGPAGFLAAASPTTLRIEAALHPDDPLHGLSDDQSVGLIVMDFAKRRRLRINGAFATAGDGGFEVDVTQVYGNCPQYIHPRQPALDEPADGARLIHRSGSLRPDDVDQVRAANTFFLGTSHPDFGSDASHRGGPAGFVRAKDDLLAWPDFPGNNLFNSLGNIVVDPVAALLFIDFATGRTLQLSGSAAVRWFEEDRAVQFGVLDVVASSVPALRRPE
jgi:predicted pyridoxine 5'-phosphate oxidase superfamily flavin-nucleotide-binding protein